MRDAEAEAGLTLRIPDPYAPYQTLGLEIEPGSADPYRQDFYKESNQQLPLVSNPVPFRGDYEDYDDRKSLRDEDYDACATATRPCPQIDHRATEARLGTSIWVAVLLWSL
jgi:hypothetical protein